MAGTLRGVRYWARIVDNGFNGSEALILSRYVDGSDGRRVTQRAVLTWEEVPEGRMYTDEDAVLKGEHGELTRLLQAALGQKAVGGEELGAVRYHLEDMRRLVFREGWNGAADKERAGEGR